MKNAHTPGPWTVEDDGCIYGSNAAIVADPHYEYILDYSEREANARLIATAPELLEWMEITMSYLPPEHMAVKRAKEIMAKIKGEGE